MPSAPSSRAVSAPPSRCATVRYTGRHHDDRALVDAILDEAALRATLVLRLGLDEASAKVRDSGPVDDEADRELPHVAGLIPVRSVRGDLVRV